MSPVLSRLMAAAAGVLRNCRPRYTRDEESYFDELASALSDMEGEAAGPVVVTSDAHVVTCRCCGEELDVDTDFDTLSASGRHMVLTLTCSHERETDVRYVLASEAAGPVDIDEPVATMADEPIGLREAFAAGAEYMRRSSRIVHDEVPAIGSAYQSGRDFVRVPRMEMPDAERITAAAAGYVEGLSGPSGDIEEPGADPRMTGGAS